MKDFFGGLRRGIEKGLGCENGKKDDVWALCGSAWQASRRVGHVGRGKSGVECMGNSLWKLFEVFGKIWSFLEGFGSFSEV